MAPLQNIKLFTSQIHSEYTDNFIGAHRKFRRGGRGERRGVEPIDVCLTIITFL